MAKNKTAATEVSVEETLAAIAQDEQRKDCEALVKLLRKITKQNPKMWGPSIVGFGSYHYKYDSGREGDACRVGFAARKSEIVIYLAASGPQHEALLAQLGKHKTGKSCLYLKRLEDVDVSVLEKLIRESLAELQRRYG